MTRKIIRCLTGLVVFTLLIIILLPGLTLHFGKSYSGQIYGFEEGVEEGPSEFWDITFYAVTFHNEDMYADPKSAIVLQNKKVSLPEKVTYSIIGTEMSDTVEFNRKKAVIELNQKEIEPFLYDLYEQGPHSTLIKLMWNNHEEMIELPFFTSFSRRQYPWYLKFLERELG